MIDSRELAKLNRELAEIGKKLIEEANEVPGEITRDLTDGANDIRNTILKSMRNTKHAPWFYWRSKGRKVKKRGGGYLKSAKRHFPSAPGEPPAIDFGELVRTIMFDVRETEMEIGSEAGAPYAEFLEFGTEKMKARPWLDPAVEKHKRAIIDRVGDGVFEMISRPFGK